MHDTQKKRIEELLVAALEGGSNYWINRIVIKSGEFVKKYDTPKAIQYWDFLQADAANEIQITTAEDCDCVSISLSKIKEGYSLMKEQYPKTFKNDIETGDFDAETADIFLQLVCFKEIVFG